MDKNDPKGILGLLQDNLRISINEVPDYYGNYLKVTLWFGDKVVSEDSISMPEKCSCNCGNKW